jgi:hypothetical protein
MFHIYTCIENTSTIFTLLYPLHLPSPSCYYPPPKVTCSTVLPFNVCLFIVQCSFTLIFCLWTYCTSISLTFSIILIYPFPLTPYYSAVFSVKNTIFLKTKLLFLVALTLLWSRN